MAEAVERFFPLVYAAYMRSRESVTLTQAQIKAMISDNLDDLSKGERAQLEKIYQQHADL